MSPAGQSSGKQKKTRKKISTRANSFSTKNQRTKKIKSFAIPAPKLQCEHEREHVEQFIVNTTDAWSKLPLSSRTDKQFRPSVYASPTPSPCAGTPTLLSTNRWLFLYVIAVYAHEQTGRATVSSDTYVMNELLKSSYVYLGKSTRTVFAR